MGYPDGGRNCLPPGDRLPLSGFTGLSFEINVLGDIYEAFFLVPAGLVGLWLLHRGSPWGPLLIAGIAANLTYNYAMVVTGRQNLWIFFWIVKLALLACPVMIAATPCGGRPGRPPCG